MTSGGHGYTRRGLMGVLQLTYLCMWKMEVPLEPQRRCDGKLQENWDKYVHIWGSKILLEKFKDHHNNQDPGMAQSHTPRKEYTAWCHKINGINPGG